MTRDVYAWIDPWAALDGPRIVRDLEWSPEDIAAMQRPGVVQFVPNRIKPSAASVEEYLRENPDIAAAYTRFDAKTQDERDTLCLRTGGVAGGMVRLETEPDPKPDRSVPIWLLAIIMLGIAFGIPAISGLIAAALVNAGWVS